MHKLHIITCISNPVRFESRYRLYREFAQRIANEANAQLWTVEIAFSDRPHEVTEPGNPHHLQLRSDFELWHKENMLNLMLQRLPDDGNPVAFIDADVDFMRPDWVEETIQQLRHYDVVQMFGEAIDLDADHKRIGTENRRGVVAQYHAGVPVCQKDSADGYGNDGVATKQGGHPGYAWAWRRSAINAVGGLIDFSILGSADWQMACGLLGKIEDSINYQISEGYMRHLQEWGAKARRLRRNVGYVEGMLVHYWHGPKGKRGYDWRTNILTRSNFDPHVDLHRDWQGVHQLYDDGSDRSLDLRDDLRRYFRSRNEDHPA